MTHIELKTARVKFGLTQKEFAKMVFRTPDCIAKWESGKYPIPKHLSQMIKGFNI